MRTGIATFTLDWGQCPKWLFNRMVKLGREMTNAIILEYGPDEFIMRLSDPIWFQSLGTVLAFDWNASGLTTTLTAALKEAIRGQEKELGIFICGGKGKTSRKTPEQIQNWGETINLPPAKTNSLVYASKMSAKVDSSLLQDGFQIYHHAFFFSKNGSWTVVQQGMNTETQRARRYHWHSKSLKDFVVEPHTGIASQGFVKPLNLTAKKSEKTRRISTALVDAGYKTLIKDIKLLKKYSAPTHAFLEAKIKNHYFKLAGLKNMEYKSHPVMYEDFSQSKYLEKILYKLCERKPKKYEEILAQEGVGPKTIRALSLVAELIYGAQPSYEDPARYSFAHGGKDATPYPVDRRTYDQTIEKLKKAVRKTKLSLFEKQKALKKLNKLSPHKSSPKILPF